MVEVDAEAPTMIRIREIDHLVLRVVNIESVMRFYLRPRQFVRRGRRTHTTPASSPGRA